MNTATGSFMPRPPTFSDEIVEQCKQSLDFRPMLFEWYKYVGVLCNTAACISPDSPALRKIPPVHYAVLIGLLNRCSRLMLANVRLSSTRRYGETTRLLDRSIEESAVKVQWLCRQDNPDGFLRYLADGLKKDLILKNHIEKNIESRNGDILVIERRMLDSIQECINLSELSEQEVSAAKSLPGFDKMCQDLQLGDRFYIAIQRMGSHAVHGTWSDLIFNYLRHENGQRLYPRDHEIDTQDVQFIVVSRLVLAAIRRFLGYVIADDSDASDFITILNDMDEKLVETQRLAWASDFDEI